MCKNSHTRSFAGWLDCRWLSDRESGQFKGCGFIEFYDEESTKKAGKLNGQDLMGRACRIDFAKPRPPKEW